MALVVLPAEDLQGQIDTHGRGRLHQRSAGLRVAKNQEPARAQG
jgi:hypothetical protein